MRRNFKIFLERQFNEERYRNIKKIESMTAKDSPKVHYVLETDLRYTRFLKTHIVYTRF